jgi:uncharacterized damage-inducible protein DinB
MVESLVESWLINNRVDLLLIDTLSDEGLRATLSERGGRSVGQQLVHVLDVRRRKIEKADAALAKKLPKVTRADGHDRKKLHAGFERSADAVVTIIRRSAAQGGKVKGFKRGIVAYVSYLMAHDAHHRGHALLTVKQSKIKRPDELIYGLWAWNNI